ncbi:hypothetical protein Nepgr_022982 [Nepenthes gracilis]|uniref:Uncharacterized protein n=1 Tax=Nepenthes gracilis TaxID=150966 RepID=A0AAD3T0G0_NEPGR|nr:hypothetical protein Nepgr_022982 [Nepenthes gracilis]
MVDLPSSIGCGCRFLESQSGMLGQAHGFRARRCPCGNAEVIEMSSSPFAVPPDSLVILHILKKMAGG